APALWSGGMGDRTLRKPAHSSTPTSIRSYTTSRKASTVERSSCNRREHTRVLVPCQPDCQRKYRSRQDDRVCAMCSGHVVDCVRRFQLGSRLGSLACCGGASSRRSNECCRRVEIRDTSSGRITGAGNRFSRRYVSVSELGSWCHSGASKIQPHDSCGFIDGNRGSERCREDHARQAAMPALRSSIWINRR